MKNHEINRYVFGALSLEFLGLCVPFLSEKAKEKIAAMPIHEANRANRDAWEQKHEAARRMKRHCNASVPSNSSAHDRALQHYEVADAVRKETWKRMCGSI